MTVNLSLRHTKLSAHPPRLRHSNSFPSNLAQVQSSRAHLATCTRSFYGSSVSVAQTVQLNLPQFSISDFRALLPALDTDISHKMGKRGKRKREADEDVTDAGELLVDKRPKTSKTNDPAYGLPVPYSITRFLLTENLAHKTRSLCADTDVHCWI